MIERRWHWGRDLREREGEQPERERDKMGGKR